MTEVYTSVESMKNVPHVPGVQFQCGRCKLTKDVPADGISTGYGYGMTGEGYTADSPVCFACCGEIDRETMVKDGKYTLYLSRRKDAPARERGHHVGTDYELTNWPGTLRLPVHGISTSRHNRARIRCDVAFRGPDGKLWRGTQYGDNTQICHVRRAK